MNVLMIEVRAENLFGFVQSLLTDPEPFADRRANAARAHEMVERIRIDEAIHVAYLQLVLSELRSLTLRTPDGREIPGAQVVDPMWATLVRWHAVENPRLARAQMRDVLHQRIRAHAGGERLVAEFDALG